jgi:transposase
MQTAMTLEGAIDEAAFESFVRQVLLPTLRSSQMVIMDNLLSHKTDRIEQLVIPAGCRLLFLPAYSPDLSPIKEAFSKLKAFVRHRCQTCPYLMGVIERGLNQITASDAKGWFANAGLSV